MDSLSALWARPPESGGLGLAPALVDEALRGIDRFGTLRRYEAGHLPTGTSAPDAHLHVVLNGWLADQSVLKKGERHISDLSLPGEIAGLGLFVLPHGPYEIEALTPARTVALSIYDLQNMTRRDPEAAAALRQVLNRTRERQRLRFFRRIVTLGGLGGSEKICHLLCEIMARTRPKDDALLVAERLIDPPKGLETEVVVLPLAQRRLAELAGLTPVHTNRLLGRMQKAHLVAIQRARIIILDPEGIAALARFEPDYLAPRPFWPEKRNPTHDIFGEPLPGIASGEPALVEDSLVEGTSPEPMDMEGPALRIVNDG